VKFAKKIVAGHDRGVRCGSLNNHYGLGCHKDTCPAFGTEYDKSKNKIHVWKSSDVEESVRIPDEMYKKILKENPKIVANWKRASHELRSKPREGPGTPRSSRTPQGDERLLVFLSLREY
jgi:hypothetical protein